MKNKVLYLPLIVLWMLLVQTNTAKAQYERPREVTGDSKRANTYLSFGSGLYYKYGLIGMGLGMHIGENVLSELTLGVGGYGLKTGVNLVFNAGASRKWRPTIGFVRGSGFSKYEAEVEVVHNLNVKKVTTTIDLPAAYAITPGFQRVFMFRNGSNFAIDLGIGISLNNFEASFSENQLVLDGVITPTQEISFTDTQNSVFRIMGPSGIICGLSFNFGLGLK